MNISDVVGFSIFTSSSTKQQQQQQQQPSPYHNRRASQPRRLQRKLSSSYGSTSILLSTRLYLSSSSSSSSSPIQRQPNEFSRIFKTDKLQSSTSRRRSITENREIGMQIEATEQECDLLAKRFDLQDLTQLDADLKLKSSGGGGGGGSSGTAAIVVQVEGMIRAKLTRTCVRTCEDFPVDIELPFRSIVRPVSDSFWNDVETALALDDYDQQQQQQQTPQKKKKKKNTKNPRRNNNFNDIDMRDLESQLTLQILMDDDDDTTMGGENNIVADEAIYSLNNDNLDVGELVAQTFWLNLDPYPKKPGTDPMELSITG